MSTLTKDNNSNTGKRMSINLSSDVAKWLQAIADEQNISQSEALRRAIATEKYLLDERSKGSKILLQKSDKEIREVVFR
jgi:metal-responsive CopG/Arc/MetJ family transcriptional regulator